MTWKASDPVSLPIYLYNAYGQALTYANAAAFTAAGWSASWLQAGAALASQPTYTITTDPTTAGSDGKHFIAFNLPQGVTTLEIVPPTGSNFWSPQSIQSLVVCANDEDSLAAGFARGGATVSASGGTSSLPDQYVTEGDGFAFQLPAILASQLSFYDATNKTVTSYANMADIGGNPWTVACQARRIENNGELPSVAVAFTLGAVVQSKTGNTCVVGWDTAPTGCQIDDLQATATATSSGGAVNAISVTSGGMYFGSTVPTVTISGTGTGATAAATVVNGVVTAITITAGGTGYTGTPTVTLSTQGDGSVSRRRFLCDVQIQPPTGSTFAGTKLTVFSFGLVVLRQQTTSP